MNWTVIGKDDPALVPGGLNRYVSGFVHGLAQVKVPCAWFVAGTGVTEGLIPLGTGPVPLRMLRFLILGMHDRASVVNTHFALHGAPYLFGRGLARKVGLARTSRRPRLVVHFHGPWAQESTAAGRAHLEAKVKRALERFVLRRADVVVLLSEAFRETAVQLGARSDAIEVVPPGLDVEWLTSVPGATAPDLGIELMCVRRLTRRMGHIPFLDALEGLDFTADDQAVRLHIVGVGEAHAEVEAWITEHGREASVLMYGYLGDEAVRALARQMHAAVVPTLALEGFGMVVLEAMAMGLPVISTGQGGLALAMGPWAKSPYIFDLHDGASVRAALAAAKSLSRDPEGVIQLKLHAQGFTWEGTARRIVDIVAGRTTSEGFEAA